MSNSTDNHNRPFFSELLVNDNSYIWLPYNHFVPRAGFKPGTYEFLLLEFAVAHKPTRPPRPVLALSYGTLKAVAYLEGSGNKDSNSVLYRIGFH